MPIEIHSTAIVSETATIGEGSVIGAYAVVEDDVILGENTVLEAHAVVKRHVRMGRGNRLHSFAVIGDLPQDIGFNPEIVSYVEIGNENTFREYVTVHRSKTEGGITVLGDRCYLMGASHIGHDCIVKNGLIMANGAVVGGHVEIDDDVFLSGNVAVHQFCKIGSNVMAGGLTKVVQDIPPFALLDGHDAAVYGLNLVGMRRRKFSHAAIDAVKALYDDWYATSLKKDEFIAAYEANESLDPAARLCIDFFKRSKRGIYKRV